MTEHKTTLRIDKELYKAARVKALEADRPLSWVIRKLLQAWVDGKIAIPD